MISSENIVREVNAQFAYDPDSVYNKDTVVVKDGVMYVSLKDSNMANLQDDSSWAKLNIKGSKHKVGNDYSPVGTILTVPVGANKFGYIDYVEGKTFDKNLYKKLYEVLGSDVFPSLDANIAGDNLPLGSIIHVIDDESIPVGWKKWEVKPNNLKGTDLIKVFKRLALNTTDERMKALYNEAVISNTFPNLEDFFLRAGINVNSLVGSFATDTVALNASFKLLPLVLSDDSLNPFALTRKHYTEVANIIASTSDTVSVQTGEETTAGIKGIALKSGTANITEVRLSGSGSETAPKHLVTHLAVKVVNKVTKASGNFKHIIKVYDAVDTEIDEVILKLSELRTETLNIKNVGSYTVNDNDNVIVSSGGTITFPDSLPVGRSFTVIRKGDSVTLDGVITAEGNTLQDKSFATVLVVSEGVNMAFGTFTNTL